MRFELALAALLGCSLNTDAIRERDASADAPLVDVAETDAPADAPEVDAREDSSIDASGDAPLDALDAGGEERCEGSDEDSDGRIDEQAVDCDGTCVDGMCADEGEILWSVTLGSTAGSTTMAQDRVFALAATASSVFAGGDIQGDAFTWSRTHTPMGADGFVAQMTSRGEPQTLVTMSSGGSDVARAVVIADFVWAAGTVTGTANVGGMTSSAATTGFIARLADGAATMVERIAVTTDLEAMARFGAGVVATGTVRARLEHPGCPTTDAANLGLVIAPGWCITLGEPGDEVFPHAIAVDSRGDVYVAATSVGNVTVGGVTIDAGSGTSAVLVKLDGTNGSVVWVRALRPTAGGRSGANALAVIEDVVVLGGQLTGPHAFVGVSGTLSSTDEDPMLLAFEADGDLAWTEQDAQPFSGGVLALVSDRDALLVAGWHSAVSFGCPALPMVENNLQDAFVARLDASTRDCVWVRTIASTSNDRARALAIDPVRDVVYVGGDLGDGATLDGPITVEGIGSDGFVAAYSR